MRRFLALLGVLLYILPAPAVLLTGGLAQAAPLGFCNAPLDTVQNVVNVCAIAPANASSSLPFLQGTVSVTGSAGASTVNAAKFAVTTESIATAASSTYTETVTDSVVTASSIPLCNVTTSGTGVPVIANITVTAGSLVMKVQNVATAAAFSSTLLINCFIVN